jgi:hypothetical protein
MIPPGRLSTHPLRTAFQAFLDLGAIEAAAFRLTI